MIVAMARILMGIEQQQELLLAAYLQLFRDDRDGVVDYDSPINASKIPAWPDGEHKIGSGLGRNGEGYNGYGAGGWGNGGGVNGLGLNGTGGDYLPFTTDLLLDGHWTVAAVAYDEAGNRTTPATDTELVALAGTPKPVASGPTPTAWNDGTKTLTITWGASPDDEG